jgi:hypothetical protein
MNESGTSEHRIGDVDREAALRELAFHTNAGRLTRQELDERSQAVAAARTRGELLALFADLPGPDAPPVRLPQDVVLPAPVAGVPALPSPLQDGTVAPSVPPAQGVVADPRATRATRLVAASGSIALIAFLFAGMVFGAWAWAWVFFLVPGALKAWYGMTDDDKGKDNG